MTARWDSLTSWHDDWSGLRVAVLGVNQRGFAVTDTLAELRASVTVLSLGENPGDLADLIEVVGARLALVESEGDAIEELSTLRPDVVVVTAGIGPEHPLVVWAAESGIAVVSDIEVSWRLRDKTGEAAPWLLATGGEGAGRAAHLAEAMLLAAGMRVMACGETETGVPVLDVLRVPESWECLVVALTADDLHFSASVSGWAAACLASDEQSGAGDDLAKVYAGARVACVYNRDDGATMTMVEEADVAEGCRAIGFGLGVPGPSDFGLVEGILCDRAFLDDRRSSALEFATLDVLDAAGIRSNRAVSEVLAAAALARSFGAPISAVAAALRELRPAGE